MKMQLSFNSSSSKSEMNCARMARCCSHQRFPTQPNISHMIWTLRDERSNQESMKMNTQVILVVPYAFHFLMIVLTVLQGIFKAFEIFLYPSPDLYLSTTLSRRSFANSLVIMVESLLWHALPGRGNLQEQLILFWNNQNHYNLTQVEANKLGAWFWRWLVAPELIYNWYYKGGWTLIQ